MDRTTWFSLVSAWLSAVVALLGVHVNAAVPRADVEANAVLFDFEGEFNVEAVETRDVTASLVDVENGRALRLAAGHNNAWPGITLRAPEGGWNLASRQAVVVDVENLTDQTLELGFRLDSPPFGSDGDGDNRNRGADYRWQQQFTLEPGERTTCRVMFRHRMPPDLADRLFGMRGYPGGRIEGRGIDPTRVTSLWVFVTRPTVDHLFSIDQVRAVGSRGPEPAVLADPDRLFPMIDRFGQFSHADWPGKTHSEADLAQRLEAESADLAAHPDPADWNLYGGWAAGPDRKATGFFRAEKFHGRWWLVDPTGKLFWSHGVDCVRAGGYTPITDREHWFAELPQRDSDSPFAPFYGKGSWAPHGYYQGKRYETYNFSAANLLRKHGPDWQRRFADISRRRLRAWGMNTIGNWSDPQIYGGGKTPYVVGIHVSSKPLEGSTGYWKKFPDVFDPDFRESLAKRMEAERATSAGDPWCIGYFVDNELSWGDEVSLATAALASPPNQPAKRAFVERLRARYDTIEKLNDAWGSRYASWDALLESREPPNCDPADHAKARDDLTAFYSETAERYFRLCRDTVKAVAPNNLYLGCRFAWVNDRAVRAAAKYCDVVSFNQYRETVADFVPPGRVDKPVIIGEFHFGALDRGMFHPGLRETADQAGRAQAYRNYVLGALENPYLVGTHWFQYGDQATTGRGDGENYQIGLVDICDTPYTETIEAVRQVGNQLYSRRFGRP